MRRTSNVWNLDIGCSVIFTRECLLIIIVPYDSVQYLVTHFNFTLVKIFFYSELFCETWEDLNIGQNAGSRVQSAMA